VVRKLRDWWPGAIYHIMCRGSHREDIYRDDEDRKEYLSILGNVKMTHPHVLHAYCLMTNHVHLLLETKEMQPGPIMKMINMKYAIFFNRKYDLVGPLFQGRFRAEIIDCEGYFLELNRYIHFNPVKANMVKDPSDYRWSSYKEYLGQSPNLLVETEKALGIFSEPRIEHYVEFVKGGSGVNVGDFPSTLPTRLLLDEVAQDLESEASG